MKHTPGPWRWIKQVGIDLPDAQLWLTPCEVA
jgi:hypothetical protein